MDRRFRCLCSFGCALWIGIASDLAVLRAQTDVIIDSTQWAELVDSLNYGGGANAFWLANIYGELIPVSQGGVAYGAGEGIWRIVSSFGGISNQLNSVTNGLEMIHDDLWETIAPLLVDMTEVNVQGFGSVESAVVSLKPPLDSFAVGMTNLNASVDAIEWDVDSLASWGTPDTGPGIRVQLSGTPSVYIDAGAIGTMSGDLTGVRTNYDGDLTSGWFSVAGPLIPTDTNVVDSATNGWGGTTIDFDGGLMDRNPIWIIPWVDFTNDPVSGYSVTSSTKTVDLSEVPGVEFFRSIMVALIIVTMGMGILSSLRGSGGGTEG